MTATELLAELQIRGITLSADNGNLQIDAPRDALTPELRQCLIEHKAALLTLLRQPREQEVTQTPQTLPSTILGASYRVVDQELNAAWEHWHELEELIATERANSDASDPAVQLKLTQLRLQAAQAERAFLDTERQYKALYDQPENYVTLHWPRGTQCITISGKWHELRSGEIEATYSREELALCLSLMGKHAMPEQKTFEEV